MRTILHSDLNGFYASVECLLNPDLQSVPMAVCGDPKERHGIVLAKNQLAKKMGVATAEPIWKAKQKCTNLVVIKPRMHIYIEYAKRMRSIYAEYSDRVEPFGLDEAWLDVTDCGEEGETVADELRKRAKTELGLTVSVGVSFNKVFAKLGSDMRKPDATTCINYDNYKELVWPLPAGDLLFVGKATAEQLYKRNIMTIGDIARCSRKDMKSALGKHGEMLWLYSNGLDNQPVAHLCEEEHIKSISNSITTPRDMTSIEDARLVILALSDKVTARLKKRRLKGRTIEICLKDTHLMSIKVQIKLERATCSNTDLYENAMKLLTSKYVWKGPLRSIGLGVSSLEAADYIKQMSMFDNAADDAYMLNQTIEEIRRKYGGTAVLRASMLHGGNGLSLDSIIK